MDIPLNRREIEVFKDRFIETIRVKIQKARQYDLRNPLILSIYINEYRSIYMDRTEWSVLVKENKRIFDNMYPFHQIFIWGLANNDALLITPDEHI